MLTDRRLLIFAPARCFSRSATRRCCRWRHYAHQERGNAANLFIAACIVLPQLIVALISPTIGRVGEARATHGVAAGICDFADPLRGLLFAASTVPCRAGAGVGRRGRRQRSAFWSRSSSAMSPAVPVISIWRSASSALRSESAPRSARRLAGWVGDRFRDPAAFACLAALGWWACAVVLGRCPRQSRRRDRARSTRGLRSNSASPARAEQFGRVAEDGPAAAFITASGGRFRRSPAPGLGRR